MSQIIYPITHLPPVIDIGKQTEKGVTRIGFDMHEWLDDWPGMTFSVQPVRPGEAESYIAATEQVGDILFWLVGSVDTEKAGAGTLEVLGVTEDERKLSAMCRTSIATTNTVSTAEIPAPNQPWVDQVILAGESAKADALDAAKSAITAAESAAQVEAAMKGLNEDFGNSSVFIVRAKNKSENFPVQYADRTQEEIRAAVAAGKTCVLVDNDGKVYTYWDESTIQSVSGEMVKSLRFMGALNYDTTNRVWYRYAVHVRPDRQATWVGSGVRTATQNKLKLTGAVKAEFDGSAAVTVEIPNASLPETADPLKQLVTDADGKVAWEDRLAYKYTTGEGEVVNLPPTALVGVDSDEIEETKEYFTLTTLWAVDIEAGKIYDVTYNGKTYACPAVRVEEDGLTAHLLGDTDQMGISGGNPDAPFFMICFPNSMFAPDWTYLARLQAKDGANSVTISVSHIDRVTKIKTIDPDLLPRGAMRKTVTLTFDAEGNITSDTPFAEAWAMTPAELQSSIVIKAPYNNYYGNRAYTVESVGKQEGSPFIPGKGITLRVQSAIPFDTSDVSQNDVVFYIGWTAAGLSADSATTQFLPRIVLANSYLKYVNGYWRAVSIDTLKEDLTCVVNVTVDSTETVLDCDKTFAQVAEAINAGKDVRALVRYADDSMGLVLRLAMLGGNGCAFNGTWIVGSGADAVKAAYTFAMNSNGTNSYEMRMF